MLPKIDIRISCINPLRNPIIRLEKAESTDSIHAGANVGRELAGHGSGEAGVGAAGRRAEIGSRGGERGAVMRGIGGASGLLRGALFVFAESC